MPLLDNTRRQCRRIREHYFPVDRRPIGLLRDQLKVLADPQAVLLDIGCGREAVLLRSQATAFAAAYGVDPEITAEARDGNVTLLPGTASRIPLPSESVDVAISTFVLEHLEDPAAFFAECRRVLKPSGHLLVLTPNAFHLPFMIARVLPHGLKVLLNKLATGTPEEDTFPALYRANSVRRIRRLAGAAGLESLLVRCVPEHPQYLMFSVTAYRLALWLGWFLRRPRWLSFLHHSVLGHLWKRPVIEPATKHAVRQATSSLALLAGLASDYLAAWGEALMVI